MLPLPAAIKGGCGGGREETEGDMRICVISFPLLMDPRPTTHDDNFPDVEKPHLV